MPVQKTGFTHTVFFWLKNPENTSDREALQAGLLKLAQIDLIQEAFVGKVADTNREVIDSTYDFSITFLFANSENQEAYQTNADHYTFIDNCSHLWKKVQVYDAISL